MLGSHGMSTWKHIIAIIIYLFMISELGSMILYFVGKCYVFSALPAADRCAGRRGGPCSVPQL